MWKYAYKKLTFTSCNDGWLLKKTETPMNAFSARLICYVETRRAVVSTLTVSQTLGSSWPHRLCEVKLRVRAKLSVSWIVGSTCTYGSVNRWPVICEELDMCRAAGPYWSYLKTIWECKLSLLTLFTTHWFQSLPQPWIFILIAALLNGPVSMGTSNPHWSGSVTRSRLGGPWKHP